MELSVFIEVGNFIGLVSGRSVPAILRKQWGFLELGPLLTFIVSLGNVMVPVGVSFSLLICYNQHIMRLKVQWKWTHLPSWIWF